MRKKILLIIITLLIISGCMTTKRTKKIYNFDDIANEDDVSAKNNNILILYSHTRFRYSVVNNLYEKFKGEKYSVIVKNLSKMKQYDPADYELIIVFSGIHAFIPNAKVRSYLKKNNDKNNLIHVYCTFFSKKGVVYKKGRFNNVDTITGASVKKNIDPMVEEILKLSMIKLGYPGKTDE